MILASPSAEPALADLVEAWHGPLFCFAFCLTGSREEAARLTQETFRRWIPEPAVRGGEERRRLFKGLYRLAAGPAAAAAAGPAAAPPWPARAVCAGAEVVARLRPEELAAAFRQLDAACRAPLALSYAGDFSAAEIAEITGVPLEAALGRLTAGKAQLLGALAAPRQDPAPRWAAAG